MREPLSFFVQGDPKGQPRARACIRGKRAGVYDPGTADAWKMAVAEVWRNVAQREAGSVPFVPFESAVRLVLNFNFRRPASHYGTGKNAKMLKESAPTMHTAKPDLDNLAKAVMDVLTRLNAWSDDCLVTTLIVRRAWAVERTGCSIIIRGETTE
jgi:Holliday junction resolvase RusA-like endonuclease